MLAGAYAAGAGQSSASKGNEREQFVDSFLSQVMPPPFRFGTGDVTDIAANTSGQLDVVVEFPFLPSLPIVGASKSRLYLAEGVAAAIEVKSTISSEWDGVLSTASKLSRLRRDFGAHVTMAGPPPLERIPFFAVGYAGWKNLKTVKEKVLNGVIDGILVLDSGFFVSGVDFGNIEATGDWSLWGLIGCLHTAASTLKATSANPIDYAR